MDKKNLTEQEIRSRYIRPAIVRAGWEAAELREEYYFTDTHLEAMQPIGRRPQINTPATPEWC